MEIEKQIVNTKTSSVSGQAECLRYSVGPRCIVLYFGTKAQLLKMCPHTYSLLLHNYNTTVQSLSAFGCFCQC